MQGSFYRIWDATTSNTPNGTLNCCNCFDGTQRYGPPRCRLRKKRRLCGLSGLHGGASLDPLFPIKQFAPCVTLCFALKKAAVLFCLVCCSFLRNAFGTNYFPTNPCCPHPSFAGAVAVRASKPRGKIWWVEPMRSALSLTSNRL